LPAAAQRARDLWRQLAVSLPAIAFTAWIFQAGTDVPTGPATQVNDKLLHFCAFGVLALSYVLAIGAINSPGEPPPNWRYPRLRVTPWALLLAAGGAVTAGALLEFWQSFLSYRSADWIDLLADAGGATSTMLATGLVFRRWLGPVRSSS
jgi:hypothetical protein